jgi:hypothetical protein
MENLSNSLNWFEVPVINFERARKFYRHIYNYDMPSAMMGDNQLGFFPVQPGGIGGAIILTAGHQPAKQGTLVYLNGGDDLNRVLNRVEKAGGSVIQQKAEISAEHGFFALFIDTEGNRLALHSMK